MSHISFARYLDLLLFTSYFLPLLCWYTEVPGVSSPFRNNFFVRGRRFLPERLVLPQTSRTMTSSPDLTATAQLQEAFLLQDL